MYSTSLSWQDIKDNLILHYSDKRNETSLIRDLHLLKQNNRTLEEFYSAVVEIQATINNHLMIHEVDSNIITAKRELFAKMCLNTFLSGLRVPLGSSIRAMKPESLATAFSYCVSEQNMFYIRQENRNLVRKQETQKNYTPQNVSPHYQKPFIPRGQFTNNHRPLQYMNYNPNANINRPQYFNQPTQFNNPQYSRPINNQVYLRPQFPHNFNSQTPRQTHTLPNNQTQFNNIKQPQTNPTINYQTPEPMDTSSGYTHLRNTSGQTRRFPRELHHIDHIPENTFTEDYNIPNYLPNMDSYNEIEEPENFQSNASMNQRDT